MMNIGEKETFEAKDILETLLLAAEAFVSAWALSISDLSVAEVEWAGIHNDLLWAVYSMLEQLQASWEDQGFLLAVLSVGLFFLYRKVWIEKERRPVRYGRILAAILAVLYTGGMAFYCADSLSILWQYKLNLIRSLVLLLGTYWFYRTCIQLLSMLLSSDRDLARPQGKIRNIYQKHPWLSVWIAILIAWVPHLILRYPGAMSYDNYNELMYYFGEKAYSGTQPVFHTWLFGSFVNVGYRLGHPNWGLFAFVVMQSLIMAAVLSAALGLMKRWGAPRWLRVITMLILAVCPIYTGNAAFPIKDYLYTAFLIAMMLMIMEYIREPEFFQEGRKRYLLPLCWVVCGTFMMLCRNNGIYVYVVTILALIPGILRGKKRMGRTHAGRFVLTALVCFLIPAAAYKGTEKVIEVVYDTEEGGVQEMYSLILQQTARYVRDYGDEVTEEEARVLASVLDYENLAELYQENISDPVKATYHADSTSDFIAYLKVWFQQFLKHPLCYVEATWNQNYSLFAPWKDNIVFNLNCDVGVDIWDLESSAFFHFTIPEWMEGFCHVAVSLYFLLSSMPVIGLFNNVAFYVILMFVMLIFYLGDGRKREAKVLIPLLLTFVFILLGPAVIPQPRYAFPIIYAMPAVIGYYMTGKKPDERRPDEPLKR